MTFIGEIHYFRIPVTNLEDSVNWYTTCLGLKLRIRKEDDGHYYFHFFDPSGNKLQVHW
ncbi:VOC family protein [Paenibacillus sp. FA6]|uniref:VOC family protein n=1 Tax=Paenibacillus sp. FA6 TaxID=3413029 RepID=UPI003F65C857